MDNLVAATNVGYIGFVHSFIRKSLKAGRKNLGLEEASIKKEVEELIKTVPIIYSAKGKMVEYDDYGRHLNLQG